LAGDARGIQAWTAAHGVGYQMVKTSSLGFGCASDSIQIMPACDFVPAGFLADLLLREKVSSKKLNLGSFSPSKGYIV
jgi:hypothetical protein